MPPGSALHLAVPAGAAGGGVPPGSTSPLPVPAGAVGDGVLPGSALHLPVPAGAAGGGVPLGSTLHLPVPAGAAGGGVPSFHLPISTGAFPSSQPVGLPQIYWSYLYMHQWTVLHMVSINSGNVEISWGGWGKLSKQRVRSSNGYLRLLDHACL